MGCKIVVHEIIQVVVATYESPRLTKRASTSTLIGDEKYHYGLRNSQRNGEYKLWVTTKGLFKHASA